ncbi:MAG: 5-aminolevulic acid synthase [Paracoccaceae bacterium]|nr:5-aminolevulic acid synthase [Paracoccaceae bacterium]
MRKFGRMGLAGPRFAVLSVAVLGLGGLIAGMALAGPLDAPLEGKVAKKQMFSPKGGEVQMMALDFLSADHAAILQSVAQGYAYYGAVAVSPDEDLLQSEATQATANHHSVEAASQAALAGCDKLRKGKSPCVIAALIRPKGWEARALQLSVEGTVALNKDYGKRGARAMAISPGTGFFSLAKGDAAQATALAACTAKGAKDCVIAVAD